MAGWKKRFEDLACEIESHALLKLDRFELGAPASDAEIEKAAGAAGGSLPQGMPELYGEAGSVRLEWSMRADTWHRPGGPPSGAVNLLPLVDRSDAIFGSWRDVIWFSDDDRYRHVAPFDLFTPESGAVLYPVPGATMVHYHTLGEELFSTGRTFEEYVELLFAARGYLYWPTSLCVEEQESFEVESFRADLPTIFGQSTAQLFRPTGQ